MSKKTEEEKAREQIRLTGRFADKLTDHPKLTGDYMVTSDWHIPYHDPTIAARMMQIARHFRIKQLAIVGDFWDQYVFSFFPKSANQQDATHELIAVREVIGLLLDWFERIDWCLGNHEKRLMRELDYALDWNDAIKILGLTEREWARIHRTDYMKMELDGKWRLVHPDSYSRITARIPTWLSEKHHQHVLSTHGHFQGQVFDRSGEYIAADIGGLFDYEKQEYIMKRETTHPKWNPGFAMIWRGHFYPFSMHPDMTDWDFWLKETRPKGGR